MAFTCGFFNSENGDRKYNAEQMSAIFDGIIADGVFTTIGDHMAVSAGTGMQVLVGTGKAWFDHTWNVNDAAYPLAIAASDVTLSRIDAIVLETNHSDSVRLNKLRVVQGTVASSPVKPTLTNSEKVHQHPLAWVTVAPGVTQIAASAIENAIGTSACPFVTGVIETTTIDDLFNQWNGEFDEWFENLKAQLSDNVVANLQRQIDQKVAKADVATTADIEAGTSTTKWVSPKGLKDSGIDKNEVFQIGDIRSSIRADLGDSYLLANGATFPKALYPKLYAANAANVGYNKPLRTILNGYDNPISKSVGLYNIKNTIIDGVEHSVLSAIALDSGDVISSEMNLDSITSPYRVSGIMMHYANGRYFLTICGYINDGPNAFIILSSSDLNNWSKSVFATNSAFSNFTDVAYYRNAYYCLRVYYQDSEKQVIELYKSTDGVSFSAIGTSAEISCSNSTGKGYMLFATDSYLGMFCVSRSSLGEQYVDSTFYYLMNGDTPTPNRGTAYYIEGAEYIIGPGVVSNRPSTHVGWDDTYIYVYGTRADRSSNILWTIPKSSIQGGTFKPTSTVIDSISIQRWSARTDIGMVLFGTNGIYRLSGSSPILIGNFDMTSVVTSVFAGNTENAIFSGGQTNGKSWGTFKNTLPLVSIDGCYSYIKVK